MCILYLYIGPRRVLVLRRGCVALFPLCIFFGYSPSFLSDPCRHPSIDSHISMTNSPPTSPRMTPLRRSTHQLPDAVSPQGVVSPGVDPEAVVLADPHAPLLSFAELCSLTSLIPDPPVAPTTPAPVVPENAPVAASGTSPLLPSDTQFPPWAMAHLPTPEFGTLDPDRTLRAAYTAFGEIPDVTVSAPHPSELSSLSPPVTPEPRVRSASLAASPPSQEHVAPSVESPQDPHLSPVRPSDARGPPSHTWTAQELREPFDQIRFQVVLTYVMSLWSGVFRDFGEVVGWIYASSLSGISAFPQRVGSGSPVYLWGCRDPG